MSKNRKFQIIALIALAVVALFATLSAVNSTGPVLSSAGEKSAVPLSPDSPRDECYDVSISELAQCRAESEMLSK